MRIQHLNIYLAHNSPLFKVKCWKMASFFLKSLYLSHTYWCNYNGMLSILYLKGLLVKISLKWWGFFWFCYVIAHLGQNFFISWFTGIVFQIKGRGIFFKKYLQKKKQLGKPTVCTKSLNYPKNWTGQSVFTVSLSKIHRQNLIFFLQQNK